MTNGTDVENEGSAMMWIGSLGVFVHSQAVATNSRSKFWPTKTGRRLFRKSLCFLKLDILRDRLPDIDAWLARDLKDRSANHNGVTRVT